MLTSKLAAWSAKFSCLFGNHATSTTQYRQAKLTYEVSRCTVCGKLLRIKWLAGKRSWAFTSDDGFTQAQMKALLEVLSG